MKSLEFKSPFSKTIDVAESTESGLRILLDNLELIDTKRLEAIQHIISVELRERDEVLNGGAYER